MSMYSQSSYPSSSYGQYPSYASTSRAPPPPSYYGGYSSPPAQPAPYQQPQPNRQEIQIFRDWYTQQLSALVENNRAVIHRLAYIAREHIERFAPVISECLELHIRRVHPAIKLPAWYLLDSVSKNLGSPYTQLFSSFIAPLFLECYDHVDDSTRSKMEEMLVTWRTGGPGGVELFGQTAQRAIENAVWGDISSGGSSGPTRNQVLMELDVILSQKTRALDQNPSDAECRSHIEVLHQLRTMVQGSHMSKTDLNAIVSRLRDLARTTASTAPALPSIPPPPPAPQAAISPPPAVSTQFANISTDALSSALSSIISQPVVAPASSSVIFAPGSSTTPVPSVPDVSQLFKSLVAAGLISGDASGSAGVSTFAQPQLDDSPKFEPIIEPKPVLVDAKLVAMREYEKRILSLPVSLSASGLQKPQPSVVSMMYEELPLKCKQCARRFADSVAGQKARDDHLDLHFRQNKRAGQTAGRGYTRSWFVGVEDWVNDISNDVAVVDVKGKGRADLAPTSAKAIAAAAVERDASLRQMYVVVPPGDESKTIKCPICKEQLKTEFMEDDEEWVWRNAIMVKGKVYHATCHADALSSQTAARLRDLTNRGSTPSSSQPQSRSSHSRSRSGTPEHTASAPTIKVTGSPLRRGQTITPPPSTTSASFTNIGGTKRKSPSRDDNESQTPPSHAPFVDGTADVKIEADVENNQSQPNKRARTSPPPPAESS